VTIGTVHLFVPRIQRYRAPFYELVGRSERIESLLITTNEPLPPEIDAPEHYSVLQQGPPTRSLGLEYHPGWRLKGRSTGSNDALVLLGNPRYLSNIGLWRDAKSRSLAIVCWGIGIMPYQKPLRHRLRMMMFRHADAALFYSDREVEKLGPRLGTRSNKLITATNNTIDRSDIEAAVEALSDAALAAFSRQRGMRNGEQLFLFVGTLHEKSRLDVLIRALATPPLVHRLAQVAVIGSGPNMSRYQQLARDLGVADRVSWIGPLYDEAELAPWFLSATAYVYPGSVGLGVQHAFAYGLPVVSIGDDVALTSEGRALIHEYNGLHYRDLSPEHLASTLAAPSPSQWRHLSEGAAATAESFSLEHAADRFVDAAEAAVRRVVHKSAG